MSVPHQPVRWLRRPSRPRAVVLLLHGGREAATEPPPRWNLPALRMLLFVPALARAAPHAVIAMARYRHRGWNGDRADAAHDARRALARLTAAHPGVPVVLVGHSMGGRAALTVGGDQAVWGVVALAPWCPVQEPAAHLAGRPVTLVHSDADRVTSAVDTWRFAARARAAGVAAHGLEIPDSDHAMVRRGALWHRLTARLVRDLLTAGGTDSPTSPPALAAPVSEDAPLRGTAPTVGFPAGETDHLPESAVPTAPPPTPRADLRLARRARRTGGDNGEDRTART